MTRRRSSFSLICLLLIDRLSMFSCGTSSRMPRVFWSLLLF